MTADRSRDGEVATGSAHYVCFPCGIVLFLVTLAVNLAQPSDFQPEEALGEILS
jgi:hypothetical protein